MSWRRGIFLLTKLIDLGAVSNHYIYIILLHTQEINKQVMPHLDGY